MRAVALQGAVGALASALVLLTGCTSEPVPQGPPNPDQTGLQPPAGLDEEASAAWTRWQSWEPNSYHYRLRVLCFCPTVDAEVVVDGGRVESVADQPYEPGTVTGFGESDPTVEGLFTELARAMRRADDVDAVYDPASGVPTRIDVDWMTNAIDDEVSYRVSNLDTSSSR